MEPRRCSPSRTRLWDFERFGSPLGPPAPRQVGGRQAGWFERWCLERLLLVVGSGQASRAPGLQAAHLLCNDSRAARRAALAYLSSSSREARGSRSSSRPSPLPRAAAAALLIAAPCAAAVAGACVADSSGQCALLVALPVSLGLGSRSCTGCSSSPPRLSHTTAALRAGKRRAAVCCVCWARAGRRWWGLARPT